MNFNTPDDLRKHYDTVKARIAAAAKSPPPQAQPLLVVKPAPPPPIEEEADLRAPLLAGAPIGPSRDLVEPVLQRHQLTYKDVAGRDRRGHVVAARHECMWVLRQAGMTLPKIGRFLRRDHTTVLYGVLQHDRRR